MMAENCGYGSWRIADALLYRAWTLTDRKIDSRGKARLAGGHAEKSSSPYGLNLTEFTFGNEAWCALDAPGPNEALVHAQQALLASDACILCVSSAPEEAVLAAPDSSGGPLHFQRCCDRFHRAAEFDQETVAHDLEDAAVVAHYSRLDDAGTEFPEVFKRCDFISLQCRRVNKR
ncbi:hypothetical protein ABID08_000305 [Rhizobium binae]|uniref:Uncharacterized protein n=1 Tax=Rhizobium binae TaxID=1138190 RepID=A0ABV2M997_9HYPH